MKRRDAIKSFLYGSAGLGFTLAQLESSPFLSSLLAGNASLDAFENLSNRHLLRKLLLPSLAYAAEPASMPCIITIRVMNLIHSPLCFAFPEYSGSNANYKLKWNNKINSADALKLLLDKGVDRVSDNPRFKNLLLNNWWSQILETGVDETGNALSILKADDYGPFPSESEVALQAALQLNKLTPALNHSIRNTLLPRMVDGSGGDLTQHLLTKKIISSPLGITCLSMGNAFETTDGDGFVSNRTLAGDWKTIVAAGRTVPDYVHLLSQSLSPGFIDSELLNAFDKLAQTDTSLRQSMTISRSSIQGRLDSVTEAGNLATAKHDMSKFANAGAFQGSLKKQNDDALLEFISQCLFVKRTLDLPGKPMRSFSLLLNMFDLDGLALDVANNGNRQLGLSYVEGMRQLAMGLNILAQAVKKHRDVYVVVVSEGGRSASRADEDVGHAFFMGPGGSTSSDLVDALYANKAVATDSSNPFVGDPNRQSSGLQYLDDNVVCDNSGSPVKSYGTTGGFLQGIVRYIENRHRIPATTTGGMGEFIRIKTRA